MHVNEAYDIHLVEHSTAQKIHHTSHASFFISCVLWRWICWFWHIVPFSGASISVWEGSRGIFPYLVAERIKH